MSDFGDDWGGPKEDFSWLKAGIKKTVQEKPAAVQKAPETTDNAVVFPNIQPDTNPLRRITPPRKHGFYLSNGEYVPADARDQYAAVVKKRRIREASYPYPLPPHPSFRVIAPTSLLKRKDRFKLSPAGIWEFAGDSQVWSDAKTIKALRTFRLPYYQTMLKELDLPLEKTYSEGQPRTAPLVVRDITFVLYYSFPEFLLAKMRYAFSLQQTLYVAAMMGQEQSMLGEMLPSGIGTYGDMAEYLPDLDVRRRTYEGIILNLQVHVGVEMAQKIKALVADNTKNFARYNTLQKAGEIECSTQKLSVLRSLMKMGLIDKFLSST